MDFEGLAPDHIGRTVEVRYPDDKYMVGVLASYKRMPGMEDSFTFQHDNGPGWVARPGVTFTFHAEPAQRA